MTRLWQIWSGAGDTAFPLAISSPPMIGDRWGVTDAETVCHYPCDDIVPAPALSAWRGVTVRAPADRIWPWITQIRLAPYSYDWIDNFGRQSPRELRDLPEPSVGEHFTTAMGGRALGRILAVRPGFELTGTIMGSVMSYVLVPVGEGTTRLLLKVVVAKASALTPLLCVGDLVMARKQLLTFAELAQRSG